MNQIKIHFFFALIISIFFFLSGYAHYSDEFMEGDIVSDSGNKFCYKFHIGNTSKETIFNWKINFDLESDTVISGLRGGKHIKNGNTYTINGLDRNENLNIGHTNVEVGFCANGTKRPLNIHFVKGVQKYSQKNYIKNENNEDDYEYHVDENADTDQNCYINTEVISKTNLVKNGGFEIFTSGNIFADWYKNTVNDYFTFIGKLSTLENWTSLSNTYKIWKNGEIKSQEGDVFMDIDYGNTLSQDIITGAGKKYELSFYSLGTDELEVQWNGTVIHQQANTYSGIHITEGNEEINQSGSIDALYTSWSGVSLLPSNITTGGYTINGNIYQKDIFISNYREIYKITGSILLNKGKTSNDLDFKKGDDILDVGTLNVDARLGDGNDIIRVKNTTNSLYGENGDDTLEFQNDAGYIHAGNENDTVKIIGNANNTVDMGDGDDKVDIGGTIYELNGGIGNDTLYLRSISSIIWNENQNNIQSKIISFENILFSDGVKIGFSDENQDISGTGVIEENYNGGLINKSGWLKYTYIVNGNIGKTKLAFSNTKINFEDEKKGLQGNNYCNKYKTQPACEGTAWIKSICKWDNNNCISKDTYKYSYNCGWNSNGGVVNFNYSHFRFSTGKNKIHCDIRGSSKKIYTGDGDDYMRYKFGNSNYINLGGGVNIFTHSIYDSQLINSTIEGGGGFNKLIIEDEDIDNFDIVGDCANQCVISLKNTLFTGWNNWRFNKNTFKNIHEIVFKNSTKEYNQNKTSSALFETDVRLGLDNVSIKEITQTSNVNKIDLMNLITDTFKNTVSNSSCSNIFYSLEESVKKELIQKLLASQDYKTISTDFFNSISYSSKFNVVKNISYELIKDQITACHTEEEKELFYNAVYNQTIINAQNCILNNINTSIKKQVEMINYLKASGNTSCSMSGNTIKLNFLNTYSIYE